ncbi:MAG: hypothetical protein VXZ43_04985, partial [Pseudomonadota bacterium]|nr:hypothetical protein [Pseudomonadota bacterium]
MQIQKARRDAQPQGPRGSAGVAGTPVVRRRCVAGTAEIGTAGADAGAAWRGRIPIFAPSSTRARTRF